MAFKAINDSAGPDGLIPTLLVFGAYPRMTESNAPSATVILRATALKRAIEEIKKLRAERQVADALQMRNGPTTTAIHNLPLNSPVMVWREGPTGQPGFWSGPYNLLRVDGETCIIQLPHGPISFRSTVVKPYYTDPDYSPETVPTAQTVPDQTAPGTVPAPNLPSVETVPPAVPPKRGRGRPRKYPVEAYSTDAADITIYLQDKEITKVTQFKDSR